MDKKVADRGLHPCEGSMPKHRNRPAKDLAALLNSYAEAESIEELWSLHTGEMASFGLPLLLYGFTYEFSDPSFGRPDDLIILSNHSRQYLEPYIANQMYLHAPMLRWVKQDAGAYSWRLVQEMYRNGELSHQEQRVVAFNRSMDVTTGYTLSFRSANKRNKGGIALSPPPGTSQDGVEAIWRRNGREITAINNFFHLKLHTMPRKAGQTLTVRQREVLEWVGDGKTIQDIATLMDLNPSTVEKHLRLAREALDVETTAQAVVKATFFNQIHILEPKEDGSR